MWDVLLDALLDTLKALPILYLVYLLVGYFSHKNKERQVAKNSNRFGPLVAGAFGIVPQCGFAAVMADLFSRRSITIGTLFAVFIATSDEAFAILILYPQHYLSLLALLGIKFVAAVIFGYLIDLMFFKQRKKTQPYTGHDICDCAEDHEKHCEALNKTNQNGATSDANKHSKNLHNSISKNANPQNISMQNGTNAKNHMAAEPAKNKVQILQHVQNQNSLNSQSMQNKNINTNGLNSQKNNATTHNHSSHHNPNTRQEDAECENNEKLQKCTECHCCATNIFYDALLHTLKIAALLLIVGAILGVIIELIGADKIETLFATSEVLSIFIAGLVGLIPTCAISIILVTFFTSGVISFAALVAGLCAGAGLGLVVLFARNRNIKQNLLITGALYGISVVIGLIVLGVMQLF